MPASVISPQEGFQQKFTRSNVDVTIGGGVLNPQDPDSLILTPNGFVKFKDIKVGDEITGVANSVQTVVHAEPCGEKDFIKVILEDGSSARSALDHKWWGVKGGEEMTFISWELLESFQVSQEKNLPYDVCLFRYVNSKAIPVRIKEIQDIGKMEAICIGVSNDDELYITDDYIITKNCGKAQPYSSKVLTPKGWTTMGELKEGDIICDTYGSTQKVLRVYEKGYRRSYVVKFGNVSVKCCAEHLWTVLDTKHNVYRTVDTIELMTGDLGRFKVDCPKPLYYDKYMHDDAPLSISFYTMGRILGKRKLYHQEISESMRAKLNLMGVVDELFLTDRYLFGSIKERSDLLRGYVDEVSDDFAPNTLDVIHTLTTERIASDMAEIIFSLGGEARVTEHVSGKTLLLINMPDIDLYRTSNMNKPKVEVRHNRVYRSISYVVESSLENMRCILVDAPNHLYITDHYVPTHNTFAAILSVAEPSLDPLFRAAFTRRNLGNLKQGGGIIDDFRAAYGEYVKITTSENPRVQFPSGAYVDCLHIADETPSKLMERAKGWQYDMFYLDELTSYEFTTFSIVGTRCRGKAKWTGKIRGTTNPKRNHWTRKMLDYYVGIDGFIRKDRDGRVIYYYQTGDTVEDIVFGETKEEVYYLCKTDIDKKLKRLKGDEWTYKDMIRSFVFYAGRMSENKASIGTNASYIGSVAAVGGRRAQQLIEGNFNVDEEEAEDNPITGRDAQRVFTNDPCVNGDKWVTVDLADVGKDNVVALSWDGFHCDDIMIISDSTPKMNFERVKMFAAKHGVAETHIIYDATHAAYMMDYMPEAVPFVSSGSAIGLFSLLADRLKDECYLRLINMISGGSMSFSPQVAKSRYTHKKISEERTVQAEFLDECAVVRIRETPRGKKKLLPKTEMNQMLGKGRSMDLLDPCAMRMYPVLNFQYGEELEATSIYNQRSKSEDNGEFDVYDDGSWA